MSTDAAYIKNKLDSIQSLTQEKYDAISSRTQHLEQRMAKVDAEGGLQALHGSAQASPGAMAVDALFADDSADPMLLRARDAAAQNKKVPTFNSRITVEGSIRAALTNEGRGNVGDTSVPSMPERRGIVAPVFRSLRLLDVLPSRPTSSDAVEFIQLTHDNEDAAEQDLEGNLKKEIPVAGLLQRAEIATVAGWTDASAQVLADVPAMRQQIDNIIRNKVLSRLEHQLINGSGATGKIHGLLPQATVFVPTIATRPADVIGESLVRQANNGFSPNLVLINPLDWFRMQITQVNGDDYEYVFGSPTSPLPPALWNTAIVPTPSMPEGKGMTIDTSYTTVLDRMQMTIAVGRKNDDFIRNLITILGELRAGLEVLDPWAVYSFDLEPEAEEP